MIRARASFAQLPDWMLNASEVAKTSRHQVMARTRNQTLDIREKPESPNGAIDVQAAWRHGLFLPVLDGADSDAERARGVSFRRKSADDELRPISLKPVNVGEL